MDMQTSQNSEVGLPEAIGRLIGVTAVAIVVTLVASFTFSVAWNHGPAKILSLPSLNWAESLAVLCVVWVLAMPFRVSRVKLIR